MKQSRRRFLMTVAAAPAAAAVVPENKPEVPCYTDGYTYQDCVERGMFEQWVVPLIYSVESDPNFTCIQASFKNNVADVLQVTVNYARVPRFGIEAVLDMLQQTDTDWETTKATIRSGDLLFRWDYLIERDRAGRRALVDRLATVGRDGRGLLTKIVESPAWRRIVIVVPQNLAPSPAATIPYVRALVRLRDVPTRCITREDHHQFTRDTRECPYKENT